MQHYNKLYKIQDVNALKIIHKMREMGQEEQRRQGSEGIEIAYMLMRTYVG